MDPREGHPPGTEGVDDVEVPDSEASHSEAGRVARTGARLKREQSRLLQRVDEGRARLERARPHNPFVDAGFRALDLDVRTGGVVLSGAVAFRVFLFLVPYVFVLVVGFGVAADAADRDPTDLARDAGIGGLVAKAVGGAADLSGFSRFTALLVALVALVFGSRALLKVLRIVFGLIWGVTPSRPTSALKPMLGLLGLTTAALVFARLVDEIRERSLLLGIVGLGVSAIIPFLIALVASLHLPRQPTRWPDLVPGSVFLALGAFVLHVVTVFWIAHEIESKTDAYGAIGAALALLLWSYLLGRLITASAVVNATVWQRRHERLRRRGARQSSASSPHPREGPDDRTDRAG